MALKIISAVGRNLELGKKDGVGSGGKKSGNGGMCWHLSGDLKNFKKVTGKDPMVMGENTFRTLPALLPGRKHIVLTLDKTSEFPDEVEVFYSLDDFLEKYKNVDAAKIERSEITTSQPKENEEVIWVIGGGQMYKLFLPYATEMYLTEVDAEDKEADVFFPEFDKNEFEKEITGEGEDKGIKYSFVKYTRR